MCLFPDGGNKYKYYEGGGRPATNRSVILTQVSGSEETIISGGSVVWKVLVFLITRRSHLDLGAECTVQETFRDVSFYSFQLFVLGMRPNSAVRQHVANEGSGRGACSLHTL